jgi:hypothetical protein
MNNEALTPIPLISKNDPDLAVSYFYLRLDFNAETIFLRYTDETFRDETASVYADGENPPIVTKKAPPEFLEYMWLFVDDDENGEVWIIKYPNYFLNSAE